MNTVKLGIFYVLEWKKPKYNFTVKYKINCKEYNEHSNLQVTEKHKDVKI